MITKSSEARKREFKAVSFDVLAVGEHSMVTKMNYKPGDFACTHAHPNEQSGYVVSGSYRVVIDGQAALLAPGDSHAIPENVPHSMEVLQAGKVIDVFTPPRQDYLD